MTILPGKRDLRPRRLRARSAICTKVYNRTAAAPGDSKAVTLAGMPPSSEQLALWSAIRANPLDDTPRLVYADWLQEHGDDERAEFIRVQCAAAADLLTSW